MKRKIFIILFLLLSIPLVIGFTQDNVKYGDYLLAGIQDKISLDLEGASLVGVLKMLSEQTGLNFVSSEAVEERKITLYVNDVPLREALLVIFKANNLMYDYDPVSNIFIVKDMGKPDRELISKTYFLKYTRVEKSRLQKEINTIDEDINSSRSSIADSGSSSGGKSRGSSTSGSDKKDGILNVIKSVLSEEQKEKVTEEPITNSLVVIATPKKIKLVDQIIKDLDQPSTQIMIEVEMLDVNKEDADKVGFKFENGFYAYYYGPKRAVGWPFFKDSAWEANMPTGSAYGNLSLESMQITMQFLATRSTTKFLARPKILTVANQTAEVNLTMNEAIGVNTTNYGSTGNSSASIEREETGTKLRVTPQVNDDTGEITLYVEVWNRETQNSDIKVTGMSTGFAKNPEERGTRTIVRLLDGETFVIGGMIRNTDTEVITKVPWLGDLPVVGKIFSYKNKSKKQRELLVFLTPHITGGKSIALKKIATPEAREQNNPSKKEKLDKKLNKLSD